MNTLEKIGVTAYNKALYFKKLYDSYARFIEHADLPLEMFKKLYSEMMMFLKLFKAYWATAVTI